MYASLMLAALLVEAAIGWPEPVYRRIGHPVSWLGHLISHADDQANRPNWSPAWRYAAGAVVSSAIVLLVYACTAWVVAALPSSWMGAALQVVLATPLLASRSLYQHVAAVQAALAEGDLGAARLAVAKIVGRDHARLDNPGVARAAIESLAENMSDGVIAPLFWGVLFGLPGLAAYKAVNTLDSMIGHRTPRHEAFGGFAARLDDVANLIPARLSGLLIAVASASDRALKVMASDASRHCSPNAGWPESAMAGALGIRLAGPRSYGGRASADPWLNGETRDPHAADIARALQVYVRAVQIMAGVLAVLALA